MAVEQTFLEFSDQALCDNLHFLQDMFDRTIVQHCQKNLACRLLHMESVMKALRNYVENERKSVTETADPETIDDVKPKQSSSRMNSLGYKIV